MTPKAAAGVIAAILLVVGILLSQGAQAQRNAGFVVMGVGGIVLLFVLLTSAKKVERDDTPR
jgi:protein-S-isoprenylcysteine O-methyltransferase Ste14